MSSNFYLGTNASNTSLTSQSTTSSAPLPFPEPLPRSDFLAPGFEPSAYLSSLGTRHQTLEDLRGDLRARSQLLSTELLDLVNANYAEFLSLGASLEGGQDQVEELRVGLLSLRREFEGVRTEVAKREQGVRALVEERRALRAQMELGRRLLEWEDRLAALEGALMLDPLGGAPQQRGDEEDGLGESSEEDDDEVFTSDDDEADNAYGSDEKRAAISRVRRRVQDFQALQLASKQIGLDHPFILEQESRVMRVRNTLLLDIRGAHRSGGDSGKLSPAALLRVMALYRDMDAAREGVQVLGNAGLRAAA